MLNFFGRRRSGRRRTPRRGGSPGLSMQQAIGALVLVVLVLILLRVLDLL
jgi:hypothetical protein